MPAAAQRVHHHARGRGLAVRAGDGDRRPQRADLAEQLRAMQLGQAALAAGHTLGVVRRDRGRVDDLGAGRHVGGVVADGGLDARVPQRARGTPTPPGLSR